MALVVSAAGAIYFSASVEHIRETSGGKRAWELERNPGVRLVTPAAMIMAVLGGVQIYSPFNGHGQLSLYLTAEGTAGRITLPDRQLVGHWYEQGVTIEEIENALVLAMAQRRFRDPELPPLDLIRSLHYFLPVMGGVREKPIPIMWATFGINWLVLGVGFHRRDG